MGRRLPRRFAALLLTLVGVTFATAAPAGAQATSCERASSLGFAASSEDTTAVRRLLDAGVGVNCITTGQTALILAARWNKSENVKLLLARGADPDIEDRANMIALEVAAGQGYAEVTRILAEHMGVPDPLAPKTRVRPTPTTPTTPPARPARGNDTQNDRQGGQQGVVTVPPAPTTPPAPRAGGPVSAAPASRWAPFGTYRVGDRVQFHQSNGWFTGIVKEVGPAGSYAKGNAGTYERKYVIADDRWGGAGEARDYGRVVGLTREPFWTGFFVGDWSLGEVMAVNDRRDGREVWTEFAYASASEALRVKADGTYEWKPTGAKAKLIRGRWVPAQDGPGIVLQRGVEGRDWTFRNESNATEERIRSIETARLTSPGVMSIAAKRPLPRGVR